MEKNDKSKANPVETEVNPMETMEEVFVPKAAGEDANIFVGLNGKGWKIPRGVRCKVPKPVADVLHASEANREYADNFARQEQEKMHKVFGAE